MHILNVIESVSYLTFTDPNNDFFFCIALRTSVIYSIVMKIDREGF
jgi:hypothetical protein